MDLSAKPTKSQQLAELLIREIVTGRLPDGSKLPPERELAENLNVAVGTLRKALAELEAQELLKRVQGSGNYICAKPLTDSVYSFFRLRLNHGDGIPSARILGIQKTAKPQEAPFFGDAMNAFRIRRLRLIGDKPAALEEIWLDGRFESKFDTDAVIDSLYLFYKQTLDLIITRVEDRVGVDNVPDWAPEDCGLVIGTSCGYVARIGWNQNHEPAEFSRNWFNPALVHYQSVIK